MARFYCRSQSQPDPPYRVRPRETSMKRLSHIGWMTCVAVGFSLAGLNLAYAQEVAKPEIAKPKGLGDPGTLQSLRIEPNVDGKGFAIRGRDARQQLYVTGVYSTGQLRDVTATAKYMAEPAGIVDIDATGMVTPIADGTVTIHAKNDAGMDAVIQTTVTGFQNDIPINFKNQVVPIFTKLGCNSGGCHGKASGQNGFKLSLLGFYPDEDYEFLVKEGRGRRLFPSSPGQSLLLTKPIGKSPHGGGKRMDTNTYEYRLIARWIEQGMPYGLPTDPIVTGIKCLPEGRVMDRGANQQITVMAT